MTEPTRAPEPAAPLQPDTRAQFLEVFLAERPRMEAVVARRVGCRQTAADLVQELFLRFWRRPQTQVGELRHYLMRSAGNLAIDHLRSEDARERLANGLAPLGDEAVGASPHQALEAGSELRHVEAALRALPERTRRIFLLNRIHGRTYAEIAKAMQVSQSAVEKHMMRALQACKASLRDTTCPPGNAGP
ncbi:RNA polymerase sigma factor [Pseudomonas typographi]|uniref:RNA polymerase sigma factor n=1 Tax=Pseudomonas typographi TaxID=2715964 RepID=A0ABR7YWD7_9PSED|nr:RNA polymerase sigma factor [Pseudomonas typographi]MBD1552484.1 RNA polymerase sigma factor [Pseudomonas typographi]MBD1585574.1 RNA polymerase sigma factor [Pseudomonas typographi]MBD1597511.1 RNA polymerase sigma factor [Pseudomonas typographi]